ncbi:Protein kinase-like domain containing protein [Trema orientale]|uniref:Protein kinase-like domain containing protein n=1 Tax=Trema orientale TaxID=63057 RepID=A0A2P5FTC2_TREOI|nr:Protein kinase-like domain containing protein [Trema orientale]
MGCEPSKQGDVYSYGILVLELFTGRSPTDEAFKDDFNLHNFVKMALPDRVAQIVDSALLLREVEETVVRRQNFNNVGDINEIETEGVDITFGNPNQISAPLRKCLLSVLEIGLACSNASSNERMNIRDVTRELQNIKNAYVGLGIHGQRQRTS